MKECIKIHTPQTQEHNEDWLKQLKTSVKSKTLRYGAPRRVFHPTKENPTGPIISVVPTNIPGVDEIRAQFPDGVKPRKLTQFEIAMLMSHDNHPNGDSVVTRSKTAAVVASKFTDHWRSRVAPKVDVSEILRKTFNN